ncbi:MAG: hypothetical protein C0426_05240 [Rhodobacter sp.]|nr:hypothetical protein [Rhodobacter sp.]
MWSKAETLGVGGLVRLLAAERLMLIFIAFVGLLAVALALTMQRQVNWPPFLGGYAATLALAMIGGYVRHMKSAPRVGLALVGAGIFSGFTAVSSIFIFALFPLANPLIDPWLLTIDAALGYHWPGLIAWLADHPALAQALGYVYHSSLAQILLTIILLAALSRTLDLHRFLLVGIVTLILAVAIWWTVPSIGPSAFQQIPEAHRLATGLYYSPAYGELLRSLVEVGPRQISPEIVTGVVAFPSYHIVMALMVVWFTRGTLAFLPAALVNTAMIPATLSHGGHHLVDLFGGLAVFALGVWIANRLIRPEQQT